MGKLNTVQNGKTSKPRPAQVSREVWDANFARIYSKNTARTIPHPRQITSAPPDSSPSLP